MVNRVASICLLCFCLGLVGCDGGGGGSEDTGICSTRPATIGGSGETTAFPNIRTSFSGVSLELVSVNFVFREGNGDTTDDRVELHAEVRNSGSQRMCAVRLDARLGGFDAPASVRGPNFVVPAISNLTLPCLEPGEIGAIRTNFFMTEEDLLLATTLNIVRDGDDLSNMGEQPYGLVTLTDQRIEEVEGGYRVVQTVTSERDVVNYFQEIFARDARGLWIADLDVPDYGPTAGGALLRAGEPQELVSNVLPCEFVSFDVVGDNYFEN